MAPHLPHPIVMWELTRACDLQCHDCPTDAGGSRGPNELTTYESYKTVDQIASIEPSEFIITGGNALLRPDVGQIIDYARRRGLDPHLAVTPSDNLTVDAVVELERNGLTRMIFGIDGSTPAIHHDVHGTVGTYATTLRAMRWAECAGIGVEVNTLVCRRNMDDLEAIADVIRAFSPKRWNLHFVVPVGGSRHIDAITAEEAEEVFGRIDRIDERESVAIRVVEAPHYRRHRLERALRERLQHGPQGDAWAELASSGEGGPDSARDILDCSREGAAGFLYISHAGDVRPSEFVPLSAGNLRYRPLSQIYRGSDLLVAVRDPSNLKGKCGACEFRHLCGGSRARAWATTGDIFATDPLCAYEAHSAPLRAVGSREAEA